MRPIYLRDFTSTFFALAVFSFTTIAHNCYSQDLPSQDLPSGINIAEGIGNTTDKKLRAPTMTVDTRVSPGNVKILVDAYVKNSEYTEYPIEFRFFVNRKLFATQIRSKELTGPIGVDIGSDIASPPFNYSIVATLLHPNRQFVTIAQGAVYANSFSGVLDCTLSVTETASDTTTDPVTTEYTASAVTISQSSNNSIIFNFEGTSSTAADPDKKANISLDVNTTDNSLSGTVEIDDDIENPVSVSGTLETDASTSELTSVSVQSSDGLTSVVCGAPTIEADGNNVEQLNQVF